MRDLILVGGFDEMIELAENCGRIIFGIIDDKKCRDYKVIGTDKEINTIDESFKKIPVVLVPDQPRVRKKLHTLYKKHNFIFSSLQSNQSTISDSAIIGEGVVIQRSVNVSTKVVLGAFVKLNVACNVMHDSTIGEYTTVAPNAVILGAVRIGECCYIGANSTILPTIKICDNVIIGAGAVVTKSITEAGTYVGIPARLINLKST